MLTDILVTVTVKPKLMLLLLLLLLCLLLYYCAWSHTGSVLLSVGVYKNFGLINSNCYNNCFLV